MQFLNKNLNANFRAGTELANSVNLSQTALQVQANTTVFSCQRGDTSTRVILVCSVPDTQVPRHLCSHAGLLSQQDVISRSGGPDIRQADVVLCIRGAR